jgi:hypothetical protein
MDHVESVVAVAPQDRTVKVRFVRTAEPKTGKAGPICRALLILPRPLEHQTLEFAVFKHDTGVEIVGPGGRFRSLRANHERIVLADGRVYYSESPTQQGLDQEVRLTSEIKAAYYQWKDSQYTAGEQEISL